MKNNKYIEILNKIHKRRVYRILNYSNVRIKLDVSCSDSFARICVISELVYRRVRQLSIPKNWTDFFKLKYFPKWLRRKYPIKYIYFNVIDSYSDIAVDPKGSLVLYELDDICKKDNEDFCEINLSKTHTLDKKKVTMLQIIPKDVFEKYMNSDSFLRHLTELERAQFDLKEVKHPLNWFEAFKLKYFPKFLKKIFKVKFNIIGINSIKDEKLCVYGNNPCRVFILEEDV